MRKFPAPPLPPQVSWCPLKTIETRCLRCRRQKIKCNGSCPCDNCQRRKAVCTFEGEDTKILVTKKHLSELKRRNIELEKENNDLREQSSDNRGTAPSPGHVNQPCSPRIDMDSCNILLSPDPSSELSEPGLDGDDHNARMVNPLSTGSSKYVRDVVGRPRESCHCTTRANNQLMGCPRLSRTHLKLVTDNASPSSYLLFYS